MKPNHTLPIFILLFASINFSNAQLPFFKRYYAPGDDSKLFHMPDSTLILIGQSQGLSPVGVTQLDSDGNPIMGKLVYMNGFMGILKIVHDAYGNWILLSENNWMVKLDPAFNVLWCNSYNSTNMPNLLFSDFETHDNDSSYYITGNSDAGWLNANPSLLLLKLSHDGSVQWAKSFDAVNILMPLPYPTSEAGTSIRMLSDDNLLVGGKTDNDTINTSNDMALFKFNKAGDLLWNSVLLQFPPCAGFCNNHWGIEQIEEVADHNLYLAGSFTPYGGSSENVYVMKTDSLGDPAWEYGVHDSKFIKFILNPDSTVYFACEHLMSSNNPPRVDKLSSNGQLLWSQYYQPVMNFYNFSDIISSADGGFWGCGGSSNMDPAYIFKTDSNGSAGCFTFPSGINIGGMSGYVTAPSAFPYSESSVSVNLLSQPYTDSTATFTQYVYCGLVSLVENTDDELTIFPNPADDEVTISGLQHPSSHIEIINLVGKLVSEAQMQGAAFTIPLAHLNTGVYFLTVYSGGTVFREKLVVR